MCINITLQESRALENFDFRKLSFTVLFNLISTSSSSSLCSMLPLIYLMRHMTQLRAAWAKTTGLSVDRKASKTSRIAPMWECSEIYGLKVGLKHKLCDGARSQIGRQHQNKLRKKLKQSKRFKSQNLNCWNQDS